MNIADLRRVNLLDDNLTPLIEEAESEGHLFVRRLRDDWCSGANRFLELNELLLAGYIGGRMVAVGGLNKDPYLLAEDVGRLRHVYVSSSARRLGVGTCLVKQIMNSAAEGFAVLRLRTDTLEAASFYERLGFLSTSEQGATHTIRLRAS